ncbi:hypothetical protein BKA69DRAFT_687142 [Paraphysoderma sedebokerense]|nr:hypothetical protein BKA69DRAFT_687142 [Paraphysoderma sedebokerense]
MIFTLGPGFYTTDSINAARHFQAHSYLKCTGKKQYPDPTISYRSTTGVAMTDDPSCAPAMCAVFMTKEFWKVVPKVFLHRFKDKTKSIKLRYNLPLLEAELTGYMRRNNLAVQPLTFSEVSYKNFNMQAVVPKEHLGRIVAVCGYDSLGKEYLKNLWMDRVLNKLLELDLEKEGTFGKMFGDYLPTMFNLDYWAVMKIHSGNEYQPSRRSNAGWDMDDIGEE